MKIPIPFSRATRFVLTGTLLLSFAAPALDKEGLTLVFEDDFEAGTARWDLLPSGDWAIEEEAGTGNHVLTIVAPGGAERPYFAPRLVATPRDLTLGSFVLEARLRHRGTAYAHQDLCIVFNAESEHQFYYVHLAPEPDDGAHTIFVVDNADRESIATHRSDGVTWGEGWHDIRLTRDIATGEIRVYFDDMDAPIFVAEDRRFASGAVGIGSYNDTGSFDDVKIWAPAAADSDFVPIFDGVSLAGWKAPDMRYWSVEDGAITAQSSARNPCDKNQFLVWQGGDVANFELKAQFRLANNQGNSGIQFRSRIADDGTGVGYQADILPGGPWCGALADEYTGREPLMVPNGHKTVVDADGTRTCTPRNEPVSLRPPGVWNDYHIIARGHHIVLKVNGAVSAEFFDYDAKEFDARGILALQLRAGPPMKVQFRDIKIRHLPDAPLSSEE